MLREADVQPMPDLDMWRAPGQPLCGGTQYLKEILFKVKEIILSVSCICVIISKVLH